MVCKLARVGGHTPHDARHAMGRHLIEDRGLDEPYDGIIEYSWKNAGHLESVYSTEEAQTLLQQMQHFQSQFIDLKHSTAFFTEHET